MLNKFKNPQKQMNYLIVTPKPQYFRLNENFARYHSSDEIEYLPDAFNVKLSNGHGKLALTLVN